MEVKSAMELFEEAFRTIRDPRSMAYRHGVLAALQFKCDGLPMHLPYQMGTAEADAYFAGKDEGCAIWQDYQAKRLAAKKLDSISRLRRDGR